MLVNRKKILGIAGIVCFLILLIGLDILVNGKTEDDPTRGKNSVLDKASTQEEPLSDQIIYESDQMAYYTDRLIRRFNYKEEHIKNMVKAWEGLSQRFPQEVNSFIVPIPNRVVFEERYDDDRSNYEDYYRKLEKGFLGLGTIIDLRAIFDLHKEEYIFYRTADTITARGGYYACQAVGEMLGSDFDIPLDHYHEYMYHEYMYDKYKDVMYLVDQIGLDKKSKEYTLIENIPEDLTYFYVLANSKNICEVFIAQDNGTVLSAKQPTNVKSGVGHGAMISGKRFEWAIAEGDGRAQDKKDETLLFISDESGRYMLPYLANYYKDVYYINLGWNKIFGSEIQEIEEIFKKHRINDVIYAQNAYEIGDPAYSLAIEKFLE